MKQPVKRKLYVCGRAWTVTFVPHVFNADGSESVFGITDKDEMTIKISSKCAKQQQQSTLLHEALHAIHATGSVGHPEDEEKCVCAMELALFDLLRNAKNKWFVEFVLA